MKNEELIAQTIQFVKQKLENAEAGHNWQHTERVWKIAKHISKHEGGSLVVIEVSALLHDISDAKFNNGDETLGSKVATNFLTGKMPVSEVEQVAEIIQNVSFKGGNVEQTHHSLELNIVQDADRLDAIGAIGIARAFHYGGYKNREMYNPDILPQMNMSVEQYRNSKSTTINHFYEKLLLLADKMNTHTAKKIAKQREKVMNDFLNRFIDEWNVLL